MGLPPLDPNPIFAMVTYKCLPNQSEKTTNTLVSRDDVCNSVGSNVPVNGIIELFNTMTRHLLVAHFPEGPYIYSYRFASADGYSMFLSI